MVTPRNAYAWFAAVAHTALARMLLLSLALHIAFIMVVQPRPGREHTGLRIINARIVDTPPPSTPPAEPVPDVAVPEDLPKPPLVPVPPATTEVVAVPEPAAAAPASDAARPEAPPAVARSTPKVDETQFSRMPARDTASALPSVPVMVDTNWYQARQLDVQPKARHAIEPEYPDEARRNGVEGTVTLRVRVDEFGVVKDVEIDVGTPPGVFDESALRAFKAGEFIPARLSGRPVRAEIRIRVTYHLND